MPRAERSQATMNRALVERTVLFPAELVPPSIPKVVPRKTGPSHRRQWLVQTDAGRGRKRRVIEFPPTLHQVTMGRAGACRCQVSHPQVSRLHAALVRKPNRGVYLMDLGSAEGTFLNGERVTEKVLLMDGDRICLGDHGIEFEFMDSLRTPESRVRRWARKVWLKAAGAEPEQP